LTPLPPSRSESKRLAILIPVFNDWESLSILLPEIDNALWANGLRGSVILVDDGSTLPFERSSQLNPGTYRSVSTLELVRLRCNLGHQRAIAVGLAHLNEKHPDADFVVVMDGDGEDSPSDIPALVSELLKVDSCRVIFAARIKRFEGALFQSMYHVYRLLHWLLTGIHVRVGNFSVLDRSVLARLLTTPDLWNHYAAAIFRSRIPFTMLPIARGRRYAGKSHMQYSSLVSHGLSAIAVFGENVGARLAIAVSFIALLACLLLGAVLTVRLFTPCWATNAAGLLVVILFQALMALLVLMLLVLSGRSQARMIPLRDAGFFVESVQDLSKVP
jgi:polyisoprenyl-phosphate glycosyltransferase